MREQFPEYYRLTKSEFNALWDDGLIVLDANVLLNLYRFPQSAQSDYLKLLETAKGRIWLPHQAALEFLSNRVKVYFEQKHRFAEIRNHLEDGRQQLKKKIQSMNLGKRHPSINPDELLKSIDKAFEDWQKSLTKLESQHKEDVDDDELGDRIDNLFKGKCGESFSAEQLRKLAEDGSERYRKQVPPGFMDIDKDREPDPLRSYGEITIERKYGDYIFWTQIIEYAKAKNIKHVILVTDDDKEDWWWRVKEGAAKTIGPRPELVEEIRRRAGVELFWMYRSASFFEYGQRFFKVKVDRDSVEKVRETARPTSSGWVNSAFNVGVPNPLFPTFATYFSDQSKLATESAIETFIKSRYPEFWSKALFAPSNGADMEFEQPLKYPSRKLFVYWLNAADGTKASRISSDVNLVVGPKPLGSALSVPAWNSLSVASQSRNEDMRVLVIVITNEAELPLAGAVKTGFANQGFNAIHIVSLESYGYLNPTVKEYS